MTEQTIQIGTEGADIEMHIAKNQAGIYFVSFRLFETSNGTRFAKTNGGPVYPFNDKQGIIDMFGKMIGEQNFDKITI
jgi:hypothetical protein